eukprot:g19638.t1
MPRGLLGARSIAARFEAAKKEPEDKSGKDTEEGSRPVLLPSTLKGNFEDGALIRVKFAEKPELPFFIRANAEYYSDRLKTGNISITKSILNAAGVPGNEKRAKLEVVEEGAAALKRMVMVIGDIFLSKRDLWHMQLAMMQRRGRIIYCGYSQNFCEHVPRSHIEQLLGADGKPVFCGSVSMRTEVIFRSSSAHMFLLIEVSAELFQYGLMGLPYWQILLDCLGQCMERVCNASSKKMSHYIRLLLFARRKPTVGTTPGDGTTAILVLSLSAMPAAAELFGPHDDEEELHDGLPEGDLPTSAEFDYPHLESPLGEEGEEEEELLRDEEQQLEEHELHRGRLGRNGPRQVHRRDPGGSTPKKSSTSSSSPSRRRPSSGKSEAEDSAPRGRPRGNLPPAPPFDGDRKKNPKVFKQWLQKVDSYVEISKKIIDESEIGLRLHSALEGQAAEYLENIPARTFGGPEGWKVLLQVLQEKFDERKMHKIGGALRGFFKMSLTEKNTTLTEMCDLLDKSARACREAGLQIPDEIMTYQFFEQAGCTMERQANILLRTGGDYEWQKVKAAVDLLYPQTYVNRGRTTYDKPSDGRSSYGKGRTAHETQGHWEPEVSTEEVDLEEWIVSEDPIESLADAEVEYLPEPLARELHEVFATHRENRQKLAAAVKARGFYLKSGKGKGRSGGGGKGYSKSKGKGKDSTRSSSSSRSSSRPKGKGKARGMSLDELKAISTCGDCGELGHWRGDPQCKQPKKAHEAHLDYETEEPQENDDDYWTEWQPDYDDSHTGWMTGGGAERNVADTSTDRAAYPKSTEFNSGRKATPTSTTTKVQKPDAPLQSHDAYEVIKDLNRMKRKATGDTGTTSRPSSSSSVLLAANAEDRTKPFDVFTATADVQKQIEEKRLKARGHTSSAPEAIREAQERLGLPVIEEEPGFCVWDLLKPVPKTPPKVDLDKVRVALVVSNELHPGLPGPDEPRPHHVPTHRGRIEYEKGIESIYSRDTSTLSDEQYEERRRCGGLVHGGTRRTSRKTLSRQTTSAASPRGPVRFLDYDFAMKIVFPEDDLSMQEFLVGGDRVPRDVLSNTRMKPTVKDKTAYLTIDTACENTVGGLTQVRQVASIIESKHSVKPLITEENESYRFGPGEPRTSNHRWHMPVGIGGCAMVIKTSVLDDTLPESGKIPWLAGQDWLRLVRAVVDIGEQKIYLKALETEAELFVDHTGHLVVAVDDFPVTGWPQDRQASQDAYAGVLWATGKAYMQPNFAATHVYSPEDDPFCDGSLQERTPCIVASDKWEYLLDHPQPQMQRHSKAKDDFVWLRWSRLLRKVMIYLKAIVCSLASTRMMNQLKHRSPALVAYGEALISHDQMIEEWNPEALPPTMPPVTTQSKNFGLPWNLNYPYQPRDCPHLVEHGRRFGNAHGKFLECISCGMVWRGLDYKLVDELSLAGERDMKTLACAAGAAMNDKIRSAGCSAYQWVFGKNPSLPDDILSPDGKYEALQAMELDDELRKRNRVRALADEKLAAYRLNEAVRAAILRKSHPMKETYDPGEIVAFWREARYRQGKKGQKGKRIPAAWYRGTIIGPHKGDSSTKQNNFWISSGGKCVLAAREQIRPAFGTELWPVHEHLLQQVQDNPPEEYYDIRSSQLPPVDKQLTRKERKALEKELPWTSIPEEQKPLFREALVREWTTWLRYKAVEVLDLACSKHVESHFDPARILASRVCYRDKRAATPWLEVKPKARLVCRGDQDPDLLELRRDAPTMTRLSLMLILQLSAACADWFLVCADITGAFLQGDQSLARRKDPLFIRQPREGLPGLLPGQLLLVVRGIFGLANSPRLFWRYLRDSLIKLGFVQSTLDKAVFLFYSDHELVLVVGAHVDDLLCAGKPGIGDKVLDSLRSQFDFGEWKDIRTEPTLTYGGKEITKRDGIVTLSQESFIRALTLTPVPKWRVLMKDSSLTAQEVTELKSGGGCLHWLVGQTRPDLAAGTSLAMGGQPTVQNLLEINRLLRDALKSKDWCLKFRQIPLESARVIGFSDASWANADDLKSQAGYLIFLTGPNVFTLEGDVANLVEWRSHRIRRKCRSTLAAETMALDASTDAAMFTRELLAEMLIESYMPTQSGKLDPSILPVANATDCRSLYDLLCKDGPVSSTQEKRLTLDIGALREAAEEIEPSNEDIKEVYKWVSTQVQRADHLTKVKPSHELRDILDEGHLSMVATADAAVATSPLPTSRSMQLLSNLLECLNLALNHFDQHHLDRDLKVSGQVVVIMTAGCGLIRTRTKELYLLTNRRCLAAGHTSFQLVGVKDPPWHRVPWDRTPAQEMPELSPKSMPSFPDTGPALRSFRISSNQKTWDEIRRSTEHGRNARRSTDETR